MASAQARRLPHPAATLALAAGIVATLGALLGTRWLTNDDVGMAMAAHGVGLAAHSTPLLVYSNVAWGLLSQAAGYAVLAMAALVIAAWVLLHALVRLGAGYLLAVPAIVLVMMRPVALPQFTVTAGLLTAAAILALACREERARVRWGAVAALSAFAGYLVRYEEFLLVAAVGAALVPWRSLATARASRAVAAAFVAAIAVSFVADQAAYRGAEWDRFREFDPVRARVTDFGGDVALKARPEVLARHGFSANDVDLVRHWFFADPRIADTAKLKAMLDEVEPRALSARSLPSGLEGIAALARPALLPLLLAAAVLAAMAPGRRLAVAWAVALALLFAIGAMGRPGVLRIYFPVLALLLVAALADPRLQGAWRRRTAFAVLAGACALSAHHLWPQSEASRERMREAAEDLARIPPGLLVDWGGAFPFEHAFPPLADLGARARPIYGLDGWTHVPFTVAAAEERAGRGFIERLRSRDGVLLAALPSRMPLLDTYCRERLGGVLEAAADPNIRSFALYRVRCAPG